MRELALKYVKVIEGLGETAVLQGDPAFAAALAQCFWGTAGSLPVCPMARLCDGAGARPDKPSRAMPPPTSAAAPPLGALPQDLTASRRALLDRVHELFRKEALWRQDEHALTMLQQCHDLMTTNPSCALYRLLHSLIPATNVSAILMANPLCPP